MRDGSLSENAIAVFTFVCVQLIFVLGRRKQQERNFVLTVLCLSNSVKRRITQGSKAHYTLVKTPAHYRCAL